MIDESKEQARLLVTGLSHQEREKIQRDISFIGLITSAAKNAGCRVTISGGYAVDGALGQITRPHNDIDLEIYGNSSTPSEAVGQILELIKVASPDFEDARLKDEGRQEFYHSFFAEKPGFGVDIYYVQTEGYPFSQTKRVVKQDGTLTEEQKFDTQTVSLEGVTFEAVRPAAELADKLFKRERGDPPKPGHDQDIANLKRIVETQN